MPYVARRVITLNGVTYEPGQVVADFPAAFPRAENLIRANWVKFVAEEAKPKPVEVKPKPRKAAPDAAG